MVSLVLGVARQTTESDPPLAEKQSYFAATNMATPSMFPGGRARNISYLGIPSKIV